jgi:hypothetical protein
MMRLLDEMNGVHLGDPVESNSPIDGTLIHISMKIASMH